MFCEVKRFRSPYKMLSLSVPIPRVKIHVKVPWDRPARFSRAIPYKNFTACHVKPQLPTLSFRAASDITECLKHLRIWSKETVRDPKPTRNPCQYLQQIQKNSWFIAIVLSGSRVKVDTLRINRIIRPVLRQRHRREFS